MSDKQAMEMDDETQKRCADVPLPGTPPEHKRVATGSPTEYSIADKDDEMSDSTAALDPAIAEALRKMRVGLQRELSASVAQAVDGHAAGLVSTLSARITGMEQRQRRMEESQSDMSLKIDKLIKAVGALAAPTATQSGEAASSSAQQGSAYQTPQAGQAGPSLSGSAAAPPQAPFSPQGPREEIVLLQFRDKEFRKTMEGFERSVRSKTNYSGEVPEYSGPKFHRFLTLSFYSYDSAVEYTKVLESAKPHDRQGHRVEVIHKMRRDERPPDVKRRGAALAPYYALFEEALAKGESMEQTHETKTDSPFTSYIAMNEVTETWQELGRVHWKDDGSAMHVSKVDTFSDCVSEKLRGRLLALVKS